MRWELSAIFLVALAVRVLLALPQQQPHYFDAYYYYNVAENLTLGRGFTVDFIWNYLDAPSAVTHPSNLYWTPLSSILAWFSMALFGVSFRAAQIPFILLSTVPALLAYTVSWLVYSRRDYARLAAILTAFAPFYLRYWACPDNFAPFAASAGLSLLTMFLLRSKCQARYALLTGLLMGLSHLSRADGVLLWLPVGAVVVATVVAERRGKQAAGLAGHGATVTNAARWIVLALAGYLAIMLPWFWRTWTVIGTPLSSAATKTVFLRSYADLFSYSADLTWRSYLAWGWRGILGSKSHAAVHNLAVVVGALQFHLALPALIGLWQLRRRWEYLPFFAYAVTLYFSMTLIFTFPSTHASMLHSTGALLPFLFAAALPGIDTAVGWVARRRSTWHAPTARMIFRTGLTAIVVVISVFDYSRAVFLSLNPLGLRPLWNEASTGYLTVASWLDSQAADGSVVMVVDPPGYYYFTHRPAIVTPHEEIEGILKVASRYGAEYLILEYDHVPSLDPFYYGEATHPALDLQHTFQDANGNDIQIYEIRR
jgi:hypothetical protein